LGGSGGDRGEDGTRGRVCKTAPQTRLQEGRRCRVGETTSAAPRRARPRPPAPAPMRPLASLPVVTLLLVAACGRDGRPSGPAAAEPATAPSVVIRTGTASMEVDSLDHAVAAVRATVERLGGWVANSSVQGGHDQVRSATLELKIPAARFDVLTGSLGTVGKL